MEHSLSVLLILSILIIVLWALYRNDTENFDNIQSEIAQEENIFEAEFVGPSNTETTKAIVLGEDTVSNNTRTPVPEIDPSLIIGLDTTKPHIHTDISPTNSHTPTSGGTNMAKDSIIQHYDPQNVGFAFFNNEFDGTLNVFAPTIKKQLN